MKRADVSVTLRSKPGAAERANELGCDEWVGGEQDCQGLPSRAARVEPDRGTSGAREAKAGPAYPAQPFEMCVCVCVCVCFNFTVLC